jgi:hypothetical protein
MVKTFKQFCLISVKRAQTFDMRLNKFLNIFIPTDFAALPKHDAIMTGFLLEQASSGFAFRGHIDPG